MLVFGGLRKGVYTWRCKGTYSLAPEAARGYVRVLESFSVVKKDALGKHHHYRLQEYFDHDIMLRKSKVLYYAS